MGDVERLLGVLDSLSPREVRDYTYDELQKRLADIHGAIMAAESLIAECDTIILSHERSDEHLTYEEAKRNRQALDDHCKRLMRAASQLQSLLKGAAV